MIKMFVDGSDGFLVCVDLRRYCPKTLPAPSLPPARRRTLHPPLVHRVLLTLVPAFLIGGVVLTAIWGDNGLLRRGELQTELREANDDLRSIQRENQRLLHHLRLMEQDPIVIERAVADELEVAAPGSTIYRFESDDDDVPEARLFR